jgi:hypothetical protein
VDGCDHQPQTGGTAQYRRKGAGLGKDASLEEGSMKALALCASPTITGVIGV